MSYWRNDELESIKQTQTAIPSANGLSYGGGDRIDISVPSTIELFDGKNTYLNFNVNLDGPDTCTRGGASVACGTTRLVLDGVCGANILIKNIRIYGNNVLLEEISNYNVKVNMQYWYDADSSLRNLRAIREGALTPTVHNRGDTGGSVPVMVNTVSAPYYNLKSASPQTSDWDYDEDNLDAKMSIPLHTGIFRESFHAFPNFLFENGLKLEIDLCEATTVIKQLESVSRNRLIHANPIFHGKTDAGGTWVNDASTSDSFYLSFANNMTEVANVPFTVGEEINFCSITAVETNSKLQDSNPVYKNPIVNRIELDGTVVPPRIKITFDDTYGNPVASAVPITADAFVVYSAVADSFNSAPANLPTTTDFDATLTVSNVELIVQHVQLSDSSKNSMISDMRNDGALELEILSCTNYKHSATASNRQLTLNLPISNTKAKSQIIIPCDSSVYTQAQLVSFRDTYETHKNVAGADATGINMDLVSHSYQSGYSGVMDYLTQYQFNIDDKLVPSRPIEVGSMNLGRSVKAQHLIELEKALNQARIVPRSFRGFVDNFCIGRAFGLYDGVADLNNRTNQIQLSYEETTDIAGDTRVPAKNKLFNCFVFHIRTITVRGQSVSVQL